MHHWPAVRELGSTTFIEELPVIGMPHNVLTWSSLPVIEALCHVFV
jgi:hypothetical protein